MLCFYLFFPVPILMRSPPSDQVVTLTTVTPPMKVRILEITPNHGLLRTVPETSGWNIGEKEYVDLQPDGNSFDIMAGMIKAKT
jgi:biotin--protein ligase